MANESPREPDPQRARARRGARAREDRPPDRHADQRVADVLARRAPQLLADIHVDPLRPVALLDEDRVAVLAERLTGRLRRIVGVVDRHLAVDRRVEGGAERDDSEGRCEGDEDDDADGEPACPA